MTESSILTFRGASDASAGIALDANLVVVADDETNLLRIYNTKSPGLPLKQVDLTAFAVIDYDHPELDLEGAARIGNMIYWIGSHGRNKDGKIRLNRHCLFATEIVDGMDGKTLVFTGRVYRSFVEDLLKTSTLDRLDLKKAIELPPGIEQTKAALKKLAPKRSGLNVEGLAADPRTKILYIGFRNPRPHHEKGENKQALILPLLNTQAVLFAKASPVFGTPILLDLKGLGIRSMAYIPPQKAYLLMAGAHDESSKFVLYRWAGTRGGRLEALRTMSDQLNYEAIIPIPGNKRILLLSDDGSKQVKHPVSGKKVANKSLEDLSQRTFLGRWLSISN